MTDFIQDINMLFESHHDVIHTREISKHDQTTIIKYCPKMYDLIDKDLDYDETFYEHIQNSFLENLKTIAKKHKSDLQIELLHQTDRGTVQNNCSIRYTFSNKGFEVQTNTFFKY